MDKRGSNPISAAILLIIGFLIIFIFFAVLSEPLLDIFKSLQSSAPSNAPDIWNLLDFAWLSIPVIAIGCFIVWYFAFLHKKEYEVERW